MAQLIPDVDLESIENRPERDVARHLVGALPDDCLVFHSYPWLRPERNDRNVEYLGQGETDFVILDPNRGALTLEVKGGEIVYDPGKREWFRVHHGRRKPIQDPFEQVRRNHHRLLRAITGKVDQASRNIRCSHGYAVVFPDCEYAGLPPPGADHVIILSSKDLEFIDRRISDVLRCFARGKDARGPDQEEYRKIKEGLLPVFRLLPVLGRRLEADDERLVRATALQEEALEGLYENDRVLVSGPAGTGKTMLAMARAKEFARQGKTTLFLCFNKALAEWLRSVTKDERIVVRHFHGLCYEFCNEAKIGFRPPTGFREQQEFWLAEAADLLDRAMDMVERRYDAVVVDEAQDFHESWWMPIEMLNGEDERGPLYIFFDPYQNLFGGDLMFPDTQVKYTLTRNCRNTRKITGTCAGILEVELQCRTGAPVGVDTEVKVIVDSGERAHEIGRRLRHWVDKERLRPDQIAILSPVKRANSCLAGLSHVGGVGLVEELDKWEAGDGVLFSTVKAFKGLEADVVLLTDVRAFTPVFQKQDLYVACSRARHLLLVLPELEGMI